MSEKGPFVPSQTYRKKQITSFDTFWCSKKKREKRYFPIQGEKMVLNKTHNVTTRFCYIFVLNRLNIT